MRVGPATDAQNASAFEQSGGTASVDSLAAIERQDVQASKDAIQRLAAEVAHLNTQDLTRAVYFAEFTNRVVSALAARGGAVWLADAETGPQLAATCHYDDLKANGVSSEELVCHVLSHPQPVAVAPRSALSNEVGVNRSDHLLLLVPLVVDDRAVGVVEVQQRPNRGPAAERGYLRFLARMGSLASEYLTTRRLRLLTEQQDWAAQVERFLRDIHTSLNVQQTSATIANETRRLLDYDRVGLAVRRGRSSRLVAVSGLDSLDRRALQVRLLNRLVTCVVATGEPIWFGSGTEDLSPQIENAWNRYVDAAHLRHCGVLPLYRPDRGEEDEQQRSPRAVPIGALIVEQSGLSQAGHLQQRRAGQLAGHSAAALANAMDHESLFLLPLWQALGKLRDLLGGRNYPKVLAGTILLVLFALLLTIHTTDFLLPVKGKLQPVLRRNVFARQNGVVVDVPVEYGQTVELGQVLLRMRNTDLEVEITSLAGEIATTNQQILSTQRSLLDNPRLTTEQQNRLSAELLQLKQTVDNLQRQLALVQAKEQQLTIRAQHAGQVVTWEVQDRLLHRPVQKGQTLMTVIDPAGDWELELDVPERHIGYIIEASSRGKAELPVTFLLASNLDQMFSGRVIEIDRTAVEQEQQGNTVRVRVAIDKDELPELRADTTVTAKVGCGRARLGYVWLHDLIDTVRGRVLFWLW